MLWLLPLVCCALGAAVLVTLATRLRRELEPTVLMIDRFGREHRVALQRLRDETAQARVRRTER